ncbi:MAG: hypothetical protein K2P09_04915 [Erysipelotrichales bacterium]|nr:hypothetical protein [Erysipelotrichales bacterium]
MKNKLIQMVLIDCISYTVLSLIMSSLALTTNFVFQTNTNITQFDNLSLFIVTSIISIFITLTSFIKIESYFIENLVIIVEVFLVVYGVGGGIFHWFPFQLFYIIEAGFIALIVFFITRIVIEMNYRMIALKINQKLEVLQNEYDRD